MSYTNTNSSLFLESVDIIMNAQGALALRRSEAFRLCVYGYDGLGSTPASEEEGRAILAYVQPRLDALCSC